MSRSSAAYSLIVMYKDSVYAVRDPFGNRPLAVGELLPPKHSGQWQFQTALDQVIFCFVCLAFSKFPGSYNV